MEWEEKKEKYIKLKLEKEQVEHEISELETELHASTKKTDDFLKQHAKNLAKVLHSQACAEDEIAEHSKKISNIDTDIRETEQRLEQLQLEKVQMISKCESLDKQVQKYEKKKKGLENFLEEEVKKMKKKNEEIEENLQKLKQKFSKNIEETEKLASSETVSVEEEERKPAGMEKLLAHLDKSIDRYSTDLECPVCLETVDLPVYQCEESHLICAQCRPKVKECPECRVRYRGPPKRHRYAEKDVEEMKKLIIERDEILNSLF